MTDSNPEYQTAEELAIKWGFRGSSSFQQLAIAAIKEARAQERKRCAGKCEKQGADVNGFGCATLIRRLR